MFKEILKHKEVIRPPYRYLMST